MLKRCSGHKESNFNIIITLGWVHLVANKFPTRWNIKSDKQDSQALEQNHGHHAGERDRKWTARKYGENCYRKLHRISRNGKVWLLVLL